VAGDLSLHARTNQNTLILADGLCTGNFICKACQACIWVGTAWPSLARDLFKSEMFRIRIRFRVGSTKAMPTAHSWMM
jgi:hypothetical protein